MYVFWRDGVGLDSSSAVSSSIVATSHMLMFKLIKMQ